MAYAPPKSWYCNYGNGTSTGYYAVTPWPTLTLTGAGTLTRQNAAPATGSERVFVAIVGGTTGASEPTWTVTKGAKTASDGTVTWQECTGQPGVNGDTTSSPIWTVSQTPALGFIIYDSVTLSLQICSTSGAGGTGSAPSFSATAGVTTTDASATWTSLGLASGFGAWAAPAARLQTILGTTWAGIATSTANVFVGDNHAETQSTAMTINGSTGGAISPRIWCVDHTASVPPGSGNLKTTATVTTTGNSNMTIIAYAYFNGITFSVGTGANATVFQAADTLTFENCALVKAATTASTTAFEFTIGRVTLINTTMQFGATGDSVAMLQGALTWKNTPSAIAGATLPTVLFISASSGNNITVILEGVDLSALGSGHTLFSGLGAGFYGQISDCKLGANVTVASLNTPGSTVDAVYADSAGTNYQISRFTNLGSLTTETVVVRTNGASNGSTQTSFKIVCASSAAPGGPAFNWPFTCPKIPIWSTLTGANRVITLYGIVNAASGPSNAQLWAVCEYFGSSSSPLGSFANNAAANGLATGSAVPQDLASFTGSISGTTLSVSGVTGTIAVGQTVLNGATSVGVITSGSGTTWTLSSPITTSSTTLTSQTLWNGAAVARVNNTAYVTGNTINVPGSSQLFFCTTGGTTAGSQPGAYASAAQGGSVTDGTAVFRAGYQIMLQVTLSTPQPAMAGPIFVSINAAQPSTTFWVDPVVNLG